MKQLLINVCVSLIVGGSTGMVSYYACDWFAWEHQHLSLLEASVAFFGAAIIAAMIGCTCFLALTIRRSEKQGHTG